MTQKLLSAAAVAGNVATDFAAPSGNKYKLLYGHFTLTTDATAANRLLSIAVYDETDTFVFDIHAGAYVTASKSDQHHELMQGVYRESAFFANTLQVPFPADWVIKPGWYFKVQVTNGQAGDSYTINLVVDERHEGAKA
jgi:hypothetical protein